MRKTFKIITVANKSCEFKWTIKKQSTYINCQQSFYEMEVKEKYKQIILADAGN